MRLRPLLPVAGVFLWTGCGLFAAEPEPEVACVASNFFPDADGDGFGAVFGAVSACEAPAGMVDNAQDCVDDDAAQFPGAVWHPDEDGDGFGAPDRSTETCAHPLGWVADATDCDDTDPTRKPGGVWFRDVDADDHGDPGKTVDSCEPPQDAVPIGDDCADDDPARHPGANEVCDQIDNDCDDRIDDDDPDVDVFTQVAVYVDVDDDGWGSGELFGRACPFGAIGAPRTGDCDDTDPYINPGRTDYVDDLDANCTGASDIFAAGEITAGWRGDARNEGLGSDLAVLDLDGDGWDELLIGENRAGDNVGRVRLVRGQALDAVTRLDTEAVVTWSGEAAGAYTGGAVVLHPDLDGDDAGDAVIAAPSWQGNAGRVYLVPAAAPSGELADLATVVWTHPSANADFGRRMAAAGERVVISARRDDTGGGDRGRVYWVDTTHLAGGDPADLPGLSGAANGDRLGNDVAWVGDIDGDGSDEVAIGATMVDGAGRNSGAVYLVSLDRLSDLASIEDADRVLVGDASDQFFGEAVARVGDVDGDGLDDVGVGSAFWDRSGVDDGAAWIVRGAARTADRDGAATAYWTLLGGIDRDRFGESLSGPGDMDGDGADDVLVGVALHDGAGGSNAGAIYGFLSYRGQGTWVTGEDEPDLLVDGEGGNDLLGQRMLPAGDVNGDGLRDAWIACPGGYDNDGALYLLAGAARP